MHNWEFLRIPRDSQKTWNSVRKGAADKGRPSMKSTVKVKLTLEDVCDSKPKFEKDLYVVFLDEDVRMRFNVVTVKAVS